MPSEGMRKGDRSRVHATPRSKSEGLADEGVVRSIANADAAIVADGEESSEASHSDSLRLAVVAEPRAAARRRATKSNRGDTVAVTVDTSVPGLAGDTIGESRPSGSHLHRRRSERRPAIIHLPVHPVVPRRPPSWMLEQCQIAPARAGDQSEILQLLSGLPAAPTRGEFHAAVDHPDHDPGNRLVARLAGRIVGHVEVMPRTMMLAGGSIGAAVIDRVAVLPECRGAGHGQRLVQAAEDRMRQIGAAVAFSRTRIAPSFHEMGWAVLGRDCATPGRPTDILAGCSNAPPRWPARLQGPCL